MKFFTHLLIAVAIVAIQAAPPTPPHLYPYKTASTGRFMSTASIQAHNEHVLLENQFAMEKYRRDLALYHDQSATQHFMEGALYQAIDLNAIMPDAPGQDDLIDTTAVSQQTVENLNARLAALNTDCGTVAETADQDYENLDSDISDDDDEDKESLVDTERRMLSDPFFEIDHTQQEAPRIAGQNAVLVNSYRPPQAQFRRPLGIVSRIANSRRLRSWRI